MAQIGSNDLMQRHHDDGSRPNCSKSGLQSVQPNHGFKPVQSNPDFQQPNCDNIFSTEEPVRVEGYGNPYTPARQSQEVNFPAAQFG